MENANTGTVIVGSGLAGYTVARELRKLAPDTAITIITRDDGRSYSKPQLSTGFGQGKSADQLALASAEQMAAQLQATILNNTSVLAIDTETHSVATDKGPIQFTNLILAIGARQNPPKLQGSGAASVMTINDLTDYARFRNAVSRENPAPIVLLGAGLIGCEFANDLAGAGFKVHVVTLGETALAPLLPVELGHALQMALGTLGVHWHCNTSITTVEKGETAFTVLLANGTQIVAQAVLSATGLRPNIELALSSGIKTNRGIIVNQFMETSAPSVYAIGDCAERDGTVLPYVLPLMNQARAVAKTIAGTPTPVIYPVMPVVVKTPIHPLSFVLPNNASGQWDIQGDLTGKKCLLFRDDGKLLGFALSGNANSDKAALVKLLSTNT